MKRLVIPLTILLILAFIITGCGRTSPTPTQPVATKAAATTQIAATTKPAATTAAPTTIKPATTTAPVTTKPADDKYGGDLKVLIPPVFLNIGYPPRPVPGFNPFQVAQTIESVLQVDNQGNPVPWLATSWEVVDDKTLILKLRQGVKFHDGTDFDAAAVKWCMEQLQKEQPAELNTMKSAEVIDSTTLKVNFTVHDNLMVDYFCTKPGNMISPTAVQKNGADWAFENPVGTGPFKFTGYQRDVYVKSTEKNTVYWQPGKPYLNSIQMLLIADKMTRLTAFKAGEGHVVTGLAPRDADELKKSGNYTIITSPSTVFSLQYDSVNKESPFHDVRVRQAASHAIDTKTICDAFGYSYLKQTNQIAYPGYPIYNPDIKGYPYDPAKAKQLLTEAGYPNGFKTTIYYTTGAYDDVYLAIQSYWSKVGIVAELDKGEPAKMQELSSKGWMNGVMTNSPYMAIGYPPTKMMNFYFSPRSPFGKSVLRPDEVENLYQAAISAPTKEEMINKTKEINRLLIDKYCVNTPIFVSPNLGAKVPTLHDERIFNPWQEMWRPADAWFEKK